MHEPNYLAIIQDFNNIAVMRSSKTRVWGFDWRLCATKYHETSDSTITVVRSRYLFSGLTGSKRET